MNIVECLKSAITSVISNKMRSILTMVGIIIGIAAVITITAAGQGVTAGMNDIFNDIGFNTLDIQMNGQAKKSSDYLTVEDAELVRGHPGVKAAAPLIYFYTDVDTNATEEVPYVYLRGTTPEYLGIQNLKLLEGRFLIDSDIQSYAPVAAIEEKLALGLFGRTKDVVGETLPVNTWRGVAEITIIGVYESTNTEGVVGSMFGMPLTAFVPISYIEQAFSQHFVDNISIMTEDPNRIDDVSLELVKMLEIKHHNKDMYMVNNNASILDEAQQMMGMVTLFIALVAAISLLVGGIGVMNIMLVTVTERTREIGIRKSLGATNSNIRLQFMTEAVIITAIGGILGILIGYGLGYLVGEAIKVEASVPLWVVILATGISSGIGVIFGVYPAAKAAKLDPIEALRYE